jgi:phosphoadenosine phosphosulfate reductase
MIAPPDDSASAEQILRWAIETYGREFAISTSFQEEGMVLVDMAARISPEVRVITLDTGRLPQATYDLIEDVRTRYGMEVELVAPETEEVETMMRRFGPNLFYGSVAYRSLCCHIRKVRPLERKLTELRGYAVGLRREQSEVRQNLQKISEEQHSRLKISPLADWTKQQVRDYIATHDVPRHALYEKGYTSIGCDPCTRATLPGEDERAGRWWWENDANKECGLHFNPDGKAERTVDVLVREIVGGPRV